MWQEVIVWLIVLTAVVLSVRSILKMARHGKSCCAECQKTCPTSKRESDCDANRKGGESCCGCDGDRDE